MCPSIRHIVYIETGQRRQYDIAHVLIPCSFKIPGFKHFSGFHVERKKIASLAKSFNFLPFWPVRLQTDLSYLALSTA